MLDPYLHQDISNQLLCSIATPKEVHHLLEFYCECGILVSPNLESAFEVPYVFRFHLTCYSPDARWVT